MKHATAIVFFFAFATPAFAHMGHVGEVAGHSHWVGLAAALGAAAIAALAHKIGKDKKGKEEIDADADAEAESTEEARA